MDLRYKKMRLWASYPFALVYLVFAYKYGLDFSRGIGVIIAGLLIRLWAAGYIRKIRKLTTAGPYAFVRNPLYVGNFLIGLGFCLFMNNIFLWLIYSALFFFFYKGTVKKEEELLEKLFGKQYIKYRKEVPAFIPGLTRMRNKDNVQYSFSQAHFNGEPIRILAAGIVLSGLYFGNLFIRMGAISAHELFYAGLIILAQLVALSMVIKHRRGFIKAQEKTEQSA